MTVADDSIAVSLRNVSKMYRLFDSPKHRMLEALHPFRKKYHHEFWALRDVNLDIPRGITLGIMGRNGSGKSTLLQLVCSVLSPTAGTVEVRGRVAALLELGAGFNPEFTGRDNAIFSGIVAGFSRQEMGERLPDIEAFADIGEFIDQPVKTYSSGMFVRLAFATAIHVDADILVIDEALAVGDARFQHKCFARLAEMKSLNKTIIFVSHSPAQVTAHSDRAILLVEGRSVEDGSPVRITDRYIGLMTEEESVLRPGDKKLSGQKRVEFAAARGEETGAFFDLSATSDRCQARPGYNRYENRFGSGTAVIVDYLFESNGRYHVPTIESGETISIYFKVHFLGNVAEPVAGFGIKRVDGINVYGTNTYILGLPMPGAAAGDVRIVKFSFACNLFPGHYFFDLGVGQADGTRPGTVLDVRRSIVGHEIVSSGAPRFDGLADVCPTFEDVTDLLVRTT
jgi:ABC-type polysaccharide/polyol phosphate transport system ATPase subunit